MAIKTVSNAGGVWNVTTTWTDNIVPVAGDTVVFTTTSGNLTVNVATANLVGIDFTNYVGTITFTAAINTSGTVNLGTGGYTQAGTSGLVINGTSTISGSATWSRTFTTFGTSYTITLNNDLNITGKVTFSHSGTLTFSTGSNIFNPTGDLTITSGTTTLPNNINIVNLSSLFPLGSSGVINSNTINISGNLTIDGSGSGVNLSGTTNLILSGTGTWSHAGTATQLRNNLTINTTGAITVSGTIYYNTRTLTYTAGTVTTTGSTLNCGASCTLDCGNMDGVITNKWNNVTFSGTSQTYTLSSNLNLSSTLTLNGTTAMTLTGNTIYTGGLSVTGTGTISGPTNIVFNGTGTWNHSSVGYIQNNITINTSGTLTLGANIYYRTGTLTYITNTGTIVNTGSTLTIGASCTLDTNNITWNNVSISTGNVTSTITLNSALNCSGQLLLSSGTLTFGGVGSLNPSGSLYVQYSTNALGAIFTLNLKNNITVTNCTFETSNIYTNNGINVVSNSININGNLSLLGYGYVYGTTTLNLNCTGTNTWTHQFNSNTLQNNVNLNPSGTLTISGNIYYNTGTITHLGGTVNATGSSLWINGSAVSFNTAGMTWGTIFSLYNQSGTTGNITLLSQLNCSSFYVNYPTTGFTANGIVIFNGAFGLNVTGTLYIGTNRRSTAGDPPWQGASSLTLSGPSQCNNLQFYLGGSYVAWPVTINGSTLTVNNSINTTSYIELNQTVSGTTEIIMRGTTWTLATSGSFPGTIVTFAINVTLQPTTTLTINKSNYNDIYFRYSTRTLKYINGSGSISTTLGLVADGATLNLGNFSNWNDNDIYLGGTTTLQSDLNPNNLFTYNTAVALSGAFNINVKGNLTIGVATSGASTPIYLNGSGTQTWTSTAYLSNNLTISKTAGSILNLSANTYYGGAGGTLTYTSGNVNTTGNTLNLSITGTTNLATSGMNWNKIKINLSSATTATLNLLQNINALTDITFQSGTITFNNNNYVINTPIFNISDSAIMPVFNSLTLIITNPLYLNNVNIYAPASNSNGSGNLPTALNNSNIYISGNLFIAGTTNANYVYGATKLILNGTGTFETSVVYLKNDLIIDTLGTITFLNNIFYTAGTLKYIKGNYITTNSTLTTFDSILDTNTFVWYNFLHSKTVTLLSDLNISNNFTNTIYTGLITTSTINGLFNVNIGGNIAINSYLADGTSTIRINGSSTQTLTYQYANIYLKNNFTIEKTVNSNLILPANIYYNTGTFKYVSGIVDFNTNNSTININANTTFDTTTLDIKNIIFAASPNAAFNVTLKSDMNITGLFKSYGAVGTSNNVTGKVIFKSDVTGTQRKLTLKPGAKSAVKYTGATDINSNDGQRVYSFRGGPLTNTLNWEVVDNLYFINGGTNTNYSNGTNWAVYSGGSSSDLIPDASTNVYFDVNSTQNCTVDVASQAKILNFTGYSNARTITFTNSLTCNGDVTLGPNLETGASSLILTTAATLTSNGYDLGVPMTITGTSKTFTIAGSWNCLGLVTFNHTGGNSITLNGGNLNIKGGIFFNPSRIDDGNGVPQMSAVSGNSKIIIMNGTWSHVYNATRAYSFVLNNIDISPNLMVGGIVTLGAYIYYASGTMNYTGGVVDSTTNNNTLFVLHGVAGFTSWFTATLNTNSMLWNNIAPATTTTTTTLTLSSDLNLLGTLSVGLSSTYITIAGTGNINCYGTFSTAGYSGNSGILTLTNPIYTNNLNTTAYTAGTTTVINNSTVYISGNIRIGASNGLSAALSGTTKLEYIGRGTWSSEVSTFPYIYNEFTINTNDRLTLSGNVYYAGSTFSYIKGNVTSKGSTLNLLSNCTLSNLHKVNFDRVVITSGNTITMNEFFSGSPQLKVNVLPSSTTNYTINFTDRFEKISKHVKLTNCTISNRNQLLMLTNIPDKRTNIGIRYFNNSPNGIAENKPSVNVQPMLTPFLVGDPTMNLS